MPMPIVKIFRYHIQADKIPQYLEIQRKADAIYKKNIKYSLTLCRKQDEPGEWIEVHRYPNKDTMNKAATMYKQSEELRDLFEQFLKIMDPAYPSITEEVYDEYGNV